MKTPRNRKIDRLGVNTARLFFEEWGCVFTEIPQQNDFGKDAYVDVGDAQEISPLCVALQIKSGKSFRYAGGCRAGDYFIPIRGHAEDWRRSTVPVFGIVYDPDDCLLRWTDITAHLRSNPDKRSGRIDIPKAQVLSATSVRGEFSSAVSAYREQIGQGLVLPLMQKHGDQTSAVIDTWALGRTIPELMILLRRLILEFSVDATRAAIFYLSHATAHPDIFWHDKNQLPSHVKAEARSSFRWSPEEIAHLFSAIEPDDYGRGSLGQCCEMLLMEDPQISMKMLDAIGLLCSLDERQVAAHAAIFALQSADKPREKLKMLLDNFPELAGDPMFREAARVVDEFGGLPWN